MELRYLLDTNICIYIAKQKPMSALERFEKLAVGSVGMSIITYGELYYGAQKSHRPRKTKQFLEELIGLISPLPLPIDAAKCYGAIRRQLAKQGKPIGNNDLWIAAHAMSMNLTVVTNNCKEFSRVAKLRLENWVDEK
ncbi:MAG: type II toxin-antitoxin system VapC family toxin [Gammaproteobacteria bacterium]|nr:type II toxin-antitoxin system VapC family toxin [Gammaproteobacteria bacterium]